MEVAMLWDTSTISDLVPEHSLAQWSMRIDIGQPVCNGNFGAPTGSVPHSIHLFLPAPAVVVVLLCIVVVVEFGLLPDYWSVSCSRSSRFVDIV